MIREIIVFLTCIILIYYTENSNVQLIPLFNILVIIDKLISDKQISYFLNSCELKIFFHIDVILPY